ncbi:hypothetical protein NXY49_21010 [Bacteroides fragilis]|nr:hypothetical protein [Bacteroides fragilis]
MVLNMGNTPYVVIVNEKSDEGQKVLEALEENIEKMDIGSHRELVIFFFRMAEPSAKRSQKEKKHTGTGKDHAPVTVLRTKTQQQRGDETGFH